MPRDREAARIEGFLPSQMLALYAVLARIAGFFLAALFPRDRRCIERIDEAQEILDDLPFGEFREKAHDPEMGKGRGGSMRV